MKTKPKKQKPNPKPMALRIASLDKVPTRIIVAGSTVSHYALAPGAHVVISSEVPVRIRNYGATLDVVAMNL